uniref:Uncharacterized protein n=1 Tax=Ascaris lumbricoides TaxID=6252 RepID=A0A9J2PAX7_ASCLU
LQATSVPAEQRFLIVCLQLDEFNVDAENRLSPPSSLSAMSVEEKPEKNETRNMQQSGNVTGVVTPTTSSHIIYRRTIDEIAKKLARSSTGTHLPVRATKNSSCSHPCRGLRDECWRKSSVQIVHKPRKGVMHFHQRIVEDQPEKVPRQHSVVGSSEKLIALLKRAVAVVRLLRCSSCQIGALVDWRLFCVLRVISYVTTHLSR